MDILKAPISLNRRNISLFLSSSILTLMYLTGCGPGGGDKTPTPTLNWTPNPAFLAVNTPTLDLPDQVELSASQTMESFYLTAAPNIVPGTPPINLTPQP